MSALGHIRVALSLVFKTGVVAKFDVKNDFFILWKQVMNALL